MKLTKEQAKELSKRKWEWIVENDGFDDDYNIYFEIPELLDLANNCGLCELYYFSFEEYSCKNCPISPKREDYDDIANTGCFQKIHPYYIWINNQNIENAQAVLDLIKNIEV